MQGNKPCVKLGKCHFMVDEGTILGHKISSRGMEVDKAKIDVISILPPPTIVKGIRSFLGHAGFYRRFIEDFSKITKSLCYLLEQDMQFEFNDDCTKPFEILKNKLVTAPIVAQPDWTLPFELMCDANDYAVGAVLGKCKRKKWCWRYATEPHTLWRKVIKFKYGRLDKDWVGNGLTVLFLGGYMVWECAIEVIISASVSSSKEEAYSEFLDKQQILLGCSSRTHELTIKLICKAPRSNRQSTKRTPSFLGSRR
ncbi:hypothetical protein GQ457_17G013240 [Hibiscus cannabinus]